MNYSYNYNLRLIPKNNSINNFESKTLKKTKSNITNIINVPINYGGPIKIKNKKVNNYNKIMIKPKTPDLNKNNSEKKNNFKNKDKDKENYIYNNNKLVKSKTNVKRPNTAQQKDKKLKSINNYYFDNKGKNISNYNNDIDRNNLIYNLYYNFPNKRIPSPMFGYQITDINPKHIQQNRRRTPSPIISQCLDISNYKEAYGEH